MTTNDSSITPVAIVVLFDKVYGLIYVEIFIIISMLFIDRHRDYGTYRTLVRYLILLVTYNT